MPDYQKLYTDLFNRVTDAIAILQQAQVEAEESYILDSSDDVLPFPIPKQDGGN